MNGMTESESTLGSACCTCPGPYGPAVMVVILVVMTMAAVAAMACITLRVVSRRAEAVGRGAFT